MGTKDLSAIRTIVRQVLRDEFVEDKEWEDDELDILIGECVSQISRKKPRMAWEVLTTVANSRVVDISGIEGLLFVEKAEYPTGNYPRDERSITPLDDERVEIDTDLTPKAGGSDTLSGTVTFAKGTAAIIGSGTAFLTELAIGYHIKKSTGTRWYRIYSIESDTALTLAEAVASGDDGEDLVGDTEYCYETAYLYCAKLHTLSNETSTLTPQLEELLVLGVSGKAAIAKARSLINKVNVGGGRTPVQMEAWGLRRQDKYEEGLLGEITARTSQRYPRD